MILETAGLSFLGLGSQPPQGDLGSMLGEGRKLLITAPHASVAPGECLGIIGESGSGKSVTALSLLGLVASPPGVITAGAVRPSGSDTLSMTGAQLRRVRGGQAACIFQDPLATLHPLYTVGDQMVEAVRAHRPCSPAPLPRTTPCRRRRNVASAG